MDDQNAMTLMDRFLHWEQTQPDAICFTQPAPDGQVVDYTWREVGDQARRMAAYLQSLQLPPQSNIAILGKNTAHWIMADLAIWMAGYVSVPMYPTMNAENAQYVFEHADVRLLFVGKLDGKTDGWNEISKVIPANMPVIALPMAPESNAAQWETLIARQQALQDVHRPLPTDLATIIYTSGTTGKPKGVMHSFGSIFAYARKSGEFCQFTPRDRLLSYLPLAHVAERSFVESNLLCHGLRVYFNDRLETFAQDLLRARPTVFISMPRLWTKFYQGVCAKLPPEAMALLSTQSDAAAALKKQVLTMLGLEDTRIAFTGSASLPIEIVDWYRNLGLELLDVYGMSENFAYAHYSRPGQVRLGYVGPALPGVQTRIADNGEILIKCPTFMMGYYRQPELTADSMTPDGFFKTGDRGELDEQGRLKITGRVKELFKTSKGKYVAPAPIENKFTHQKIEAVCVTGLGSPQPFALAMLSPDGRNELRDPEKKTSLLAELERHLESVNATLEEHEKLDYMVIVKDLWSIERGFLTPTMKIRRNTIEDYYLPKAQAWSSLEKAIILEPD